MIKLTHYQKLLGKLEIIQEHFYSKGEKNSKTAQTRQEEVHFTKGSRVKHRFTFAKMFSASHVLNSHWRICLPDSSSFLLKSFAY